MKHFMNPLTKTLIILAAALTLGVFLGCENPLDNDDTVTITNWTSIDTLDLNTTQSINGTVKASLEIDHSNFTMEIEDENGTDASSDFTFNKN